MDILLRTFRDQRPCFRRTTPALHPRLLPSRSRSLTFFRHLRPLLVSAGLVFHQHAHWDFGHTHPDRVVDRRIPPNLPLSVVVYPSWKSISCRWSDIFLAWNRHGVKKIVGVPSQPVAK